MAEEPKEVETCLACCQDVSKHTEGLHCPWHLPRPAIIYTIAKVKPLAELRPSDVPMGMDPYDLATDYP
jgi:hypothetical protein